MSFVFMSRGEVLMEIQMNQHIIRKVNWIKGSFNSIFFNIFIDDFGSYEWWILIKKHESCKMYEKLLRWFFQNPMRIRKTNCSLCNKIIVKLHNANIGCKVQFLFCWNLTPNLMISFKTSRMTRTFCFNNWIIRIS